MHDVTPVRLLTLISGASALALFLAVSPASADDASSPRAASVDADDAHVEAPVPSASHGIARRSAEDAGAPIYYVDDEERPVVPFRDGTQVPNGFRLDASPRFGLVAAGASVSGALWVTSTIAAIALDKEKTVAGDPNFDDMYWPMFIPVLGPFISIGTADASGTGAGILALDGAFQAGGLALMIAGLAAPKLELIQQKGVYLNAEAGPGGGTVNLGGTF